MLMDLLVYSPWFLVPLQVILCLKCKRLIWKLLPLLIYAAAMLYFFVMCRSTSGLESFLYASVGDLFAIPIGASAAGWLIALVILLCCRLKQRFCKR